MDANDYMTVAEAAKALQITRAGAYWRIENGTLPAAQFHGRMLVPRSAVEQETHPKPREAKDMGMMLGAVLGV
jgi:excisionase family DNA binding protein